MVYTRSQRRKIVGIAEDPQVVTCESSKDAGKAFFDIVLNQIEEVVSDMASMKAENIQPKGEMDDLNI